MNRISFEEWKKKVDESLLKKCNMACDDLPDWDYWNAWDAGVTPSEAAKQVIKNAKEY